jgi:hypothetical protein
MQQERWHAPLAGALSGLALLFETPADRVGLAQQVFVRGLQGVFNRAHELAYLRVPHGNTLLFGATNAVIMGCFASASEALDKGYYKCGPQFGLRRVLTGDAAGSLRPRMLLASCSSFKTPAQSGSLCPSCRSSSS